MGVPRARLQPLSSFVTDILLNDGLAYGMKTWPETIMVFSSSARRCGRASWPVSPTCAH